MKWYNYKKIGIITENIIFIVNNYLKISSSANSIGFLENKKFACTLIWR